MPVKSCSICHKGGQNTICWAINPFQGKNECLQALVVCFVFFFVFDIFGKYLTESCREDAIQ